MFYFSTSFDMQHLKRYYNEIIDELKNYCSFFVYQAKQIIQFAEANKVICPIKALPEKTVKTKNFSKLLQNKKYCVPTSRGDVFLSKQERLCLSNLAKGFSYSEIALKMDLGPRTVES